MQKTFEINSQAKVPSVFFGKNNSLPFFQPKLTINPANDVYEKEADAMADQVMQVTDSKPVHTISSSVQRKCAHCEEEEHLQRKADNNPINKIPSVSSIVSDVIKSTGKPLDDGTKTFMESRFGYDFSKVKVHTDNVAAKSANTLNALAYTTGNNIVFNQGEYLPQTKTGKHLLAHELTHVVQQNGIDSSIQRAAIHTGNILDEGTCEHLACNSKWACEDENGVLCPEGTRNAGTKRRPLFTCDTNCDEDHSCSDTGNWMAIPHSRFARRKCDQDLVICANHNFTHGSVRDRSVAEAWEVSRGIQDSLGVAHGSFSGAIYPDEQDSAFLTDSRCR